MKARTAILLGVLLGVVTYVTPAWGEPNEITIDPHWSIEGGLGLGATAENIVEASVMYWPDYANDGAIGVMVVGGDLVPENECLVGPAVEFPTGAITDAVLGTILPDEWAESFADMTVQVRPYGRGALLFDFDFNPVLVGGTGFRLFPNKLVQPMIRTEYFHPSNNSKAVGMEGWWTSLCVTVFF